MPRFSSDRRTEGLFCNPVEFWDFSNSILVGFVGQAKRSIQGRLAGTSAGLRSAPACGSDLTAGGGASEVGAFFPQAKLIQRFRPSVSSTLVSSL